MKLSAILMFFLLSQYITLSIVCLIEGNWRKALYWVGAGIINFSIILMK